MPKPQLKCNLFFSLLVIVSLLIISMVQQPTSENYNALAQTVSTSDFNFAAVGDMGCTEDTRSTVQNMLNRDPELIFGLGDYSYENTADCWFDTVDPIDEKMKISIGNHDITPAELNSLMTHFNLSEQFYSFDYQNIHFLIMSTEIPFHTDSKQFEFVSSDLSNAAKNPATDWIFVFMHKMLYSSPSGLSVSFQDPLVITYHPLFDKYGVDLVIQGHFHIYERTYPLNFNSLTETSPQVVDTSDDNNYTNPKGPVFVTVGTGGIGLHEYEGKRPYVVTQYSGFGVLDVVVPKDGSTIEAKFYANDGTIIDEFTIVETNSNNAGANNVANSQYHYMPYITLSGSNYTDIESNDSLQLTQFSISSWIRAHNNSDGYIVNRGGGNSDHARGNNMNYGIRVDDDGRVRAFFETDEGENVRVTSPGIYNDNKWHYVVVTYDGSFFKLYINNVLTSYRPFATPPDDTGEQPVRIGGRSQQGDESFVGSIDEIRIWNRALSAAEVNRAYNLGMFDSAGQVLYVPDPSKLNTEARTSPQQD